MLIAISFVIEFLTEDRWKWLEGQKAASPKLNFRGQDIHTAISLHNLRDALLENTSELSFELCNWNYLLAFVMLNCVHTHQNTIISIISD